MVDTPVGISVIAAATQTVVVNPTISHTESSSHGGTVKINNKGADPIYIDTVADVNDTTGFKILAGGSHSFKVGKGERLYAYGTAPVDIRSVFIH
jgi:hypothetical protein